MRSSGWRGVMVVAWLLSACGDSASGEETGPSPTSAASGSGSATTSNEMTTPGTTATEDGSDAMSSSTAADSTSAPASTGPVEGTSSGSDGEGETASLCEPPPPAGNACLECAAANCCTAWAACQANEPCACVVDCHVVEGGSLGNCSNQCDLDTELYQALYFCGQQSCLGTCEWDCC